MANEEMRTEETVVENTDYLTAIKELKENSVDRSKYEALKADNKRMLDMIVNGQQVETSVPKPEVDIQALRKELFNNENQTNLQYEDVYNCKVLIPPLLEQEDIANYLDSKCAEIDSTIADKQHQLSILEQYKKSLIYEYVTGKKEVPA